LIIAESEHLSVAYPQKGELAALPARLSGAAFIVPLQPADDLDEFQRPGAIGWDVRQKGSEVGDDLVDRKLTVGIGAEHLDL
jgi:hypothetical protein